ncbi:MAG: PKD domain-containing protein [Bacteroidota bacterium]
MKSFLPILSLFFMSFSFAQTVVWQDDFETPANWTLNASSGMNGLDANLWVISDAEGGVAAGGCGVASNGNKTLHVGCQGQWCIGSGATYNAGDGGLGFIDAVTNKRALFASNINTLNTQNLSLEFDYIGIGQQGFDFGTVLYSTNGGSTWNNLQTISPAQTCASGQGLWSHVSFPLPAQCANINNLRIGFQWQNDNDGAGSDPSLAINNVKITSPAQPSVTASFTLSSDAPCMGDCISIANTSAGASTYAWSFGNGQSSTLQNPPQVCYAAPGTYNVQLIACDANTCDTSITAVTVQPLLTGTVNVTSQGSYTWPFNGMVYSTSGTYVDTAVNANACDSVVTLVLTINTGSIDELMSSSTSALMKITDLAGREMDLTKGQVMLLFYSDGSIKRIYIKE